MSTLKISLKANEKIYVNGAVIKTDRKVTLEFLNNVQFLLENHVLQAEDARTPLRQVYFTVQIMLITPENADDARRLFNQLLPRLLDSFTNERIRAGLKHVEELVSNGQVYDALKEIRALYPIEDEIIAQPAAPTGDNRLAAMAGE
ncbi:flagellar biosynthesis repressor FlbT [Nitratireductor aquimarinus]|uniref:Probable flagellum biosynthesis repressor protein FlbT n=1 Tax=Nitratireductor aquimarinus TaxID=889300 RepID=A0ABU4AGN2_9HYPH|nr:MULTISPECIES: flagellar biosynthesis repressor FlbT [Alphaproteobacteria]MBY6021662.1 flagellar biosynthesis repressor FlbT [Nitratireductor sp. DP7N14-4]MBN7756747.1 flagellar biosynthesis repressor FlbT [Nitratireductor aquimarinus]MBN7775192.1 flagellar biosynthesis repressor FlbT [Nitratireductor pacificus]MBN7781206.1 flagellar biosynthesis repressor FlbT [Nitratireductor pacificus]MBN7790012.1 flagellar biosynthesis repressor FlbT [Nitratireductor aquimarinus]